MQKSLWELSLACIYVNLSWTMKTAVVSKNHRHKSKISKYLSKQYFEKYSILTLCLNDWMSKDKNSPEYSQLIKMEEQHILEHASSLLLSLLCFYNILNVFSFQLPFDKSTPTKVSKSYFTQTSLICTSKYKRNIFISFSTYF